MDNLALKRRSKRASKKMVKLSKTAIKTYFPAAEGASGSPRVFKVFKSL